MSEAPEDRVSPEELTEIGEEQRNGELDVPENPYRAFEFCQNAAARAMAKLAELYLKGKGIDQSVVHARLWFQRAAELHDLDSMLQLGKLCEDGQGRDYDPEQALLWFRRAADAKYVPAYFYVGMAYSQGAGVRQDSTEAMRWFELGVSEGDNECIEWLDESELAPTKDSEPDERGPGLNPQRVKDIQNRIDKVTQFISRGHGNIEELKQELDDLEKQLGPLGTPRDWKEGEEDEEE